MYNSHMSEFKFFVPINVRYADLDAQWHVNNSCFLTFMELRLIIADVHVSYKAPIVLGQKVRVGTRVVKIGNKSIVFEYIIEDEESGDSCAIGEVIGVCYNFRTHETLPVPPEWREKIAAFEGKSFE